MKYSKAFLIFRRRLAKAILQILGWKFRGQDSPTSKNQIIFINKLKGQLANTQIRWMRHLTSGEAYLQKIGDRNGIDKKINQHGTVLVVWQEETKRDELVWVLKFAREKKVALSACAWDSTHKVIKFHSHFKPSPYPERDIRYLERFFIYFKKV